MCSKPAVHTVKSSLKKIKKPKPNQGKARHDERW